MSIVLNETQVTLCQNLADSTVNALWGKNGIVELDQQLMTKRQGVASNLTALYREAETGKDVDARLELFARLCECFEAACIQIDADQNKGNKRTVFEIYPSWRVMKSEMKAALKAGIPSKTPQGKNFTYGQIKDARKKLTGPKGANAARGSNSSAPKVEVTPALAAALLSVQEYIVTLDAAKQTEFAEYLTSAIARHKAALEAQPNANHADITAPAQKVRRQKAKAA
jgi:hypothetical protein